MSKHRLNTVFYCLAALLTPGIMLLYFYNRNYAANHIVFGNILLLAAVSAAAGIMLFLIFRLVSGGAESALLLTLLFWLYFWTFRVLFGVLSRYFAAIPPAGLAAGLGIFLIAAALIFRRHKPLFAKARPVFTAVSAVIVVLFIFNLLPGLSRMHTLQKAAAERDEDGGIYPKRDFIVDPTLPKPDIHWFHVDGMMSLGQVERFWGEELGDTREALADRGFLIYEDASLNGTYSIAAMPALLSPAFYDNYYRERLFEFDNMLRAETEWALTSRLAEDGLTFYNDIIPHHELFTAVASAGYEIVQGQSIGNYVEWVFENVIPLEGARDGYAYVIKWWNRFLEGDLPALLSLTTPFDIPPGIERLPIETGGADLQSGAAPAFYWHTFLYTHANSWSLSSPDLSEREMRRIHSRTDLYPTAYHYQLREVLAYVDVILEENPDAVIVLQADHGFHSSETHQSLLDQGYSVEQVLELSYSIFNAVRIPAKYGGLDAPVAPLNVTRELVNRFVGENYDLLYDYK